MSLYYEALDQLRTCDPADRGHHIQALLDHVHDAPPPKALSLSDQQSIEQCRAEIIALSKTGGPENDILIEGYLKNIRRLQGRA
jgi:hypothetical protein